MYGSDELDRSRSSSLPRSASSDEDSDGNDPRRTRLLDDPSPPPPSITIFPQSSNHGPIRGTVSPSIAPTVPASLSPSDSVGGVGGTGRGGLSSSHPSLSNIPVPPFIPHVITDKNNTNIDEESDDDRSYPGFHQVDIGRGGIRGTINHPNHYSHHNAHSLPTSPIVHPIPSNLGKPVLISPVASSGSFSHLFHHQHHSHSSNKGPFHSSPYFNGQLSDDEHGSDHLSNSPIASLSASTFSPYNSPATLFPQHHNPFHHNNNTVTKNNNKPLHIRQSPFSALFSWFGIGNWMMNVIISFGINFGIAYWIIHNNNSNNNNNIGVWQSLSSSIPFWSEILLSSFLLVFLTSLISLPSLQNSVKNGSIVPVEETWLGRGVWQLFPLRIKNGWGRSFILAIEMMFITTLITLALFIVFCKYHIFCESNSSSSSVASSFSFADSMNDCSLSASVYPYLKGSWAAVVSFIIYPFVYLGTINRKTLPAEIYNLFLESQHLKLDAPILTDR